VYTVQPSGENSEAEKFEANWGTAEALTTKEGAREELRLFTKIPRKNI